jgi:hypothetical protein
VRHSVYPRYIVCVLAQMCLRYEQNVCLHSLLLGLRALDQDDVVQTHNSLFHMQELLVSHSPSSFNVSHSDDSDAVCASRTMGRGSDTSLIASMEQLLNSHSDVVHNVLAAGDPTLYKALFTSQKEQ